jgi:hypothetical protein
MTIVCASHENLLGIVTNKTSKNGVTAAPDPIPADHSYTSLTIVGNWTKNVLHAGMKQVAEGMALSGLVLNAF